MSGRGQVDDGEGGVMSFRDETGHLCTTTGLLNRSNPDVVPLGVLKIKNMLDQYFTSFAICSEQVHGWTTVLEQKGGWIEFVKIRHNRTGTLIHSVEVLDLELVHPEAIVLLFKLVAEVNGKYRRPQP